MTNYITRSVSEPLIHLNKTNTILYETDSRNMNKSEYKVNIKISRRKQNKSDEKSRASRIWKVKKQRRD